MSTSIRAIVVALTVLALFAAYSYWAGVQQQIGYDRAAAEINADKLQRLAVANTIADGWRDAYQKAENERSKTLAENARLAADAVGTLVDLGRLRHELDTLRTRRMSRVTPQTCPDDARTFGELFGDCSARIERLAESYEAMARAAAGHWTDAAMNDAAGPVQADNP
jgi:hypothetical protein